MITIDIKGAFLKAKKTEDMELIVKMDGELAELLCKINPKFMKEENGEMYLKYKVSSKSREQLDEVAYVLRSIYTDITVTTDQTHDYLGMVMSHNKESKQVTINLEKYIQDMIDCFKDEVPEEKIKKVTTLAMNNLFKTRSDSANKVIKQKASIFHATVAKLFFIAKRARPDILLVISFLTTRVEEPDEDDWNKLKRVFGYLSQTPNFHLTLSCENLNKLTWYVDGSYTSQPDMRGQSGAVLLAGDCAVLFRSNKQEVNTRSLTETELIAIDDSLPMIQWTKNFLREQGYDLETGIREDNGSTMLFMKNRR